MTYDATPAAWFVAAILAVCLVLCLVSAAYLVVAWLFGKDES